MTDYSYLSSESYDYLSSLFKIMIDNNIVDIFMSYSQDITLIVDIVRSLGIKVQAILKAVEDEKWDFYFKIIEFCFTFMLYENEGVQKVWTALLLQLVKAPAIPLVKFKELDLLLSQFLNGFNTARTKFDVYWIKVFELFDGLFRNNENLYSSANDFDLLFTSMKKYLISFVDYNKKAKRFTEIDYKQPIEGIYVYLTEKSNL